MPNDIIRATLDSPIQKKIRKISRPMTLEVCVSLACQNGAQVVRAAQRIACENPMVTAYMIDANLYPELVQRYQIQKLPLLIVDHEKTFPGAKTPDELTALLIKIK